MSESNGSAAGPEALSLSARHAQLITGSAISPEVAAVRGYRTITVKAELGRLGFAHYQQSAPEELLGTGT